MSEIHSLSRRSALQIGAVGMANLVMEGSALSAGLPLTEHGMRTVPGTKYSYFIVPYDSKGDESAWPDGSLVSNSVLRKLKSEPITDVFIFSHGWRGDFAEAIRQYDDWVTAMATNERDRAAVRAIRSDFSPLLVGLHWPSLPLGDESIRAAAAQGGENAIENDVQNCANHLVDTRNTRAALDTILRAAQQPAPEKMPSNVSAAFRTLQSEAGLNPQGVAGRPGNDSAAFDPDQLYQDLKERNLGAFDDSGDLHAIVGTPWYRTMIELQSFWRMKRLACSFGESGAHQLLRAMQRAVPSQRNIRFHLMGHSFGCIVVSACAAGPPDRSDAMPINSLSLIQGALSLWSYCADIDAGIAGERTAKNGSRPGYFRPVINKVLVKGPIITTQSSFDKAVCSMYPWAAWWRGPRAYATADAPFPKYGAVGQYGLQGPGLAHTEIEIGTETTEYHFEPGKIYNIDSSRVICNGDGPSGAHSDLCHPEVAHVVWQAAFAGVTNDLKPVPKPTPEPRPAPAPYRPGPIGRFLRRSR